MQLIHTSPCEITKITNLGNFGDCLFFSTKEYSMGRVEAVYSIEIEESAIINVEQLYDKDIIDHIASYFNVDSDVAEKLLDGRLMSVDVGADCEADWFLQERQGTCAKKMGFEACRSIDEQGTVYIVPMFGREKELVRIA